MISRATEFLQRTAMLDGASLTHVLSRAGVVTLSRSAVIA
jgi:hypothetical protein